MNANKDISLRERIRLNLISAMDSAGINQVQLAEKLNISKGTVNNWTRGNNSPDVDMVPRICKVLGISILSLYSPTSHEDNESRPEKKTAPPYTGEAMKLAKDYDSLDKWGRKQVRSTADIELARISEEQTNTSSEPPAKVVYIKRNDLKASAGDGFLLDEESTEDFAVLYNDLTRKADFCVEVQGDSMEPKLHDGDWILVRQQPSVEVGEIGLFMVDGKGYVKQFAEDRLISLNPDYDDVFPTEFIDVRCAGLVLGVLDPDWIVEE